MDDDDQQRPSDDRPPLQLHHHHLQQQQRQQSSSDKTPLPSQPPPSNVPQSSFPTINAVNGSQFRLPSIQDMLNGEEPASRRITRSSPTPLLSSFGPPFLVQSMPTASDNSFLAPPPSTVPNSVSSTPVISYNTLQTSSTLPTLSISEPPTTSTTPENNALALASSQAIVDRGNSVAEGGRQSDDDDDIDDGEFAGAVEGRKRRHRRRYDEVVRLYQCNYRSCTKSYGTLNHLNHHIVLQSHGLKRFPSEFKDLRRWLKEQKAMSKDLSDLPPLPRLLPSGPHQQPVQSQPPSAPRMVPYPVATTSGIGVGRPMNVGPSGYAQPSHVHHSMNPQRQHVPTPPVAPYTTYSMLDHGGMKSYPQQSSSHFHGMGGDPRSNLFSQYGPLQHTGPYPLQQQQQHTQTGAHLFHQQPATASYPMSLPPPPPLGLVPSSRVGLDGLASLSMVALSATGPRQEMNQSGPPLPPLQAQMHHHHFHHQQDQRSAPIRTSSAVPSPSTTEGQGTLPTEQRPH